MSPQDVPHAAASIANGLERLVVTLACRQFVIEPATMLCVRREIARNLRDVANALPAGTQWRHDAELLERRVQDWDNLAPVAQAARDWADLIWVDCRTGVRV